MSSQQQVWYGAATEKKTRRQNTTETIIPCMPITLYSVPTASYVVVKLARKMRDDLEIVEASAVFKSDVQNHLSFPIS